MMKRKLLTILLVLLLLLMLPTHAFAQNAAQGNVSDLANLLTDEEVQTLDARAHEISEQYNVGVYIITVEDYRDYSGESVSAAAEALYDSAGFGYGKNRDGILLLLSMDDRDYNLMVDGGFANVAFNEYGRSCLADFFLVEFADDDWYGGFEVYLDWCADYLETARNGKPYTESHVPMEFVDVLFTFALRAAVVLILPLIVAGIYVAVLTSKMKSVATATDAASYVSSPLHLTQESDIYSHTTRSRRKIEQEDNSSSGGKTHSSSGSRSHTSGKF